MCCEVLSSILPPAFECVDYIQGTTQSVEHTYMLWYNSFHLNISSCRLSGICLASIKFTEDKSLTCTSH